MVFGIGASPGAPAAHRLLTGAPKALESESLGIDPERRG